MSNQQKPIIPGFPRKTNSVFRDAFEGLAANADELRRVAPDLLRELLAEAGPNPSANVARRAIRDVASRRKWNDAIREWLRLDAAVHLDQVSVPAKEIATRFNADPSTAAELRILGGLRASKLVAVANGELRLEALVGEERDARLEHERTAVGRERIAPLVAADGLVPLTALASLSDHLVPLATLGDDPCGLADPSGVRPGQALALLLERKPLAVFVNRRRPAGDAEIPISRAAAQLGVTARFIAYLSGRTAKPTTLRHDQLDRIATKLATGQVQVAQVEAEAAAAEEYRLAVVEAKARADAEARTVKEKAGAALRAALGLPDDGHQDLTTTDAAKALDISTDQVRKAVDAGNLPGRTVVAKWHYGKQTFYRVDPRAVLAARREPPAWLAAIYARREAKGERGRVLAADSRVRFPLRRQPPPCVEVFLGPTGSGKTYRALEHLAERGAGSFAAPLRMLALEAYERLTDRLGPDAVGLVTGEERMNPDAPIICATAEMAPMDGPLLVLDEVQWAADPDRGWAWTRLLAGAEVDELYVTGEVGAAPLVRSVLGEDVAITFCDRLVPLAWGGTAEIEQLPERSVAVAFSRKAVMHLAGLAADAGRSVAVLYGALPPEVRRRQVARFASGEAEILVATDVIGHGVNLPADHVFFAETQKFDGVSRRLLRDWEIAQIGGRAGRFGLSTSGTVGTLVGLAGFVSDRQAVTRVISGRFKPVAEVDGHPTLRLVTTGFLAPALSDLAATRSGELRRGLEAWKTAAEAAAASLSWAEVSPVETMIARLAELSRKQGAKTSLVSRLDLEDAWSLVRAPLDPDDVDDVEVLVALARSLVGEHGGVDHLLAASRRNGESRVIPDAARLERTARTLIGLRWATLAFRGRLPVDHDEVTRLLDVIDERLNLALQRAITDGVSRCVSCGEICAPWFSECDDCHSSQRRSYWRDDDDDYGYASIPPSEKPQKRTAERRQADMERAARLAELDARIRAAAAKDPLLDRPESVARQWWLDHAIPALLAVSDQDRYARLAEVMDAWRRDHFDARFGPRPVDQGSSGGAEAAENAARRLETSGDDQAHQ